MSRITDAIDKNKVTMLIVVLILFFAITIVGNVAQAAVCIPEHVSFFAVFSVLLLAVLCYLVWHLIRKDGDVIYISIAIISLMALCYMVLFPPITAPDEQLHYLSAYRISNYFLLNFEQMSSPAILLRECDYELFIRLQPNVTGEYLSSIYGNIDMFAEKSQNVMQIGADYVSNVPLGYIMSALGIAVARILGLGAVPTIYMGRIMNLIAFLAMLVFSVRRIPSGKLTLIFISGLPMCLQLMASYSYDVLVLGFSFVFIAQTMYMVAKQDMITTRDIIFLTIFSIILAPSKLVYVPLIFMILIIPDEKFPYSKKKTTAIKFGILSVSVAVLLVLQLSTFLETATRTDSGWSEEQPYSLTWILSNPLETVAIFVNTLKENGKYYYETMLGSLLGWLNVPVAEHLYEAHAVLIVLSSMKNEKESVAIRFADKLWIVICVVGSAMLVLLSMFIAWTPMGSSVIYGVQGRYFMPLVLPMCLVMRNRFMTVKEEINKFMVIIYFVISFMTVMELFITVAV